MQQKLEGDKGEPTKARRQGVWMKKSKRSGAIKIKKTNKMR